MMHPCIIEIKGVLYCQQLSPVQNAKSAAADQQKDFKKAKRVEILKPLCPAGITGYEQAQWFVSSA